MSKPTTKRRLLRSLNRTGPGTGSEIASTLGLKRKNVIGMLCWLVKGNEVEVLGVLPTRTAKARIYGVKG